MDVSNEKFQWKRKQFTKCGNLTTGKKSKCYRLAQNQLCANSTQVSSTLSDSEDTLSPPTEFKHYSSLQTKEQSIQMYESVEMEDISVEATVKTGVKSVQNTPVTYSKSTQFNLNKEASQLYAEVYRSHQANLQILFHVRFHENW